MTKKTPAPKKSAAAKKARPPVGARATAKRVAPSRAASAPKRGLKTSMTARRGKGPSGAVPAAPAPPTPEQLRRRKASLGAAEQAIEAALDKKGVVPMLIDVSDQATYTDYIGIVSGRSDRQVEAIADNVTQVMKESGWRLLGREGAGNGRWVLLDFGDFVLHVFYHPVREFYDIEGLWIDAPRVKLKKVPPEAMHVQPDAYYETA